MNKKKILVLAMSLAMVAILAIGGTIAYFTDTDSKINTFTTGKVDITLNENFDPENAKLLPGKANAIEKEVWIELEEGSEDAYVWFTYAIPAVLDSTDGSTGTNNIIHVNAPGATWDKYWESGKYPLPEGSKTPVSEYDVWNHTQFSPEGLIGSKMIGDVKYNVYLSLYNGVLSHTSANAELNYTCKDATITTYGMSQVYMDAGVNYVPASEENPEAYYVDKNGEKIDFDFSKIDIIVEAYAIQADGFANVLDAYNAFPVKNLTPYVAE